MLGDDELRAGGELREQLPCPCPFVWESLPRLQHQLRADSASCTGVQHQLQPQLPQRLFRPSA